MSSRHKNEKSREIRACAMTCTKASDYAWFDEFEQFKTENNIISETKFLTVTNLAFHCKQVLP